MPPQGFYRHADREYLSGQLPLVDDLALLLLVIVHPEKEVPDIFPFPVFGGALFTEFPERQFDLPERCPERGQFRGGGCEAFVYAVDGRNDRVQDHQENNRKDYGPIPRVGQGCDGACGRLGQPGNERAGGFHRFPLPREDQVTASGPEESFPHRVFYKTISPFRGGAGKHRYGSGDRCGDTTERNPPASPPAPGQESGTLSYSPRGSRGSPNRCSDIKKFKNVPEGERKTPEIARGFRGCAMRWSGRRDLNPRLQPWQGCTLPLSYARVGP